MHKLRQQQHRPPRDEQRAKELADLKRENGKLARQNARLRKQVEKAQGIKDAFEVEPEMVGGVLTPAVIQESYELMVANHGEPQVKMVPPNSYPECSGMLKQLELPKADGSTVTVEVCAICKWRRKLPSI